MFKFVLVMVLMLGSLSLMFPSQHGVLIPVISILLTCLVITLISIVVGETTDTVLGYLPLRLFLCVCCLFIWAYIMLMFHVIPSDNVYVDLFALVPLLISSIVMHRYVAKPLRR